MADAELEQARIRIAALEGLAARMEQDSIAAHMRIHELENLHHAINQVLAETEDRLAVAEATLTLWEDAADCVGPVGRPER